MLESIIPYQSIAADFYQPLRDALPQCRSRRACTELPDDFFSYLCVQRGLEDHPSGRGFLQSFALVSPQCPERSTFFEALKSSRRLSLMRETAQIVESNCRRCLPDALAPFTDLNDWDVFAADGHFWAAASHDKKEYRRGAKGDPAKFATGNLFSLCLRSHILTHLILADQVNKRKEHDITALKRLTTLQLRQGSKVGRKVLYVYDRASIDFGFWHLCKAKGIYFLSRAKANLDLTSSGALPWDRQDEVNAGVLADELFNGGGVTVRKITYQDPKSMEIFTFITNVIDGVAPGLLAMLYKMRWDIEKVFEETKIKLAESKAWASSANAKELQAKAVCLVHNLLLIYENKLAQQEEIHNLAEEKRKARRLAELEAVVTSHGRKLNLVHKLVQRITQRSVKLIRWLRRVFLLNTDPQFAYARLRQFYSEL